MATEVGSLSSICSWWSLKFVCDDSSDSTRAIILAATINLAFAAASAAATKDAVVRAAAGSPFQVSASASKHIWEALGATESAFRF